MEDQEGWEKVCSSECKLEGLVINSSSVFIRLRENLFPNLSTEKS